MALGNGGLLALYRHEEILQNSYLKQPPKKFGYGPLKNSDEQSRAISALLLEGRKHYIKKEIAAFSPVPTIFLKGVFLRCTKSLECVVKG